jgi:carotenoid cleavage dioxygenase
MSIAKPRKQRFVYGTVLGDAPVVKGIVKFDLDAEPAAGKTKLETGGNIKGIFHLGPEECGSEAVYVPRKQGTNAEEDDGYLIFFVTDENDG